MFREAASTRHGASRRAAAALAASGGEAPAMDTAKDGGDASCYRRQCIAVVVQSDLAILKSHVRMLAQARIALERD
jgi:hypothetical protein